MKVSNLGFSQQHFQTFPKKYISSLFSPLPTENINYTLTKCIFHFLPKESATDLHAGDVFVRTKHRLNKNRISEITSML